MSPLCIELRFIKTPVKLNPNTIKRFELLFSKQVTLMPKTLFQLISLIIPTRTPYLSNSCLGVKTRLNEIMLKDTHNPLKSQFSRGLILHFQKIQSFLFRLDFCKDFIKPHFRQF